MCACCTYMECPSKLTHTCIACVGSTHVCMCWKEINTCVHVLYMELIHAHMY